MKELRIYRLNYNPRRLTDYNEYFTLYRQTKDKRYFNEFLHFYEPVLTHYAQKFINRYGLATDRIDDLKQIFAQLLWDNLQRYDSELPLLQLIKCDCEREWHKYVMDCCGNVNPDSANQYNNMRKVIYLFNQKAGKNYGEIISEIAFELKITERTVINCLNASAEFNTFNNLDIDDQADESFLSIADSCYNLSPEQAYFNNERSRKLLSALASLKSSDKKLIEYSFGICTDCLGEKPKKSIREAALLLNLTEIGAHKKLRKILNNLNYALNCQERIA